MRSKGAGGWSFTDVAERGLAMALAGRAGAMVRKCSAAMHGCHNEGFDRMVGKLLSPDSQGAGERSSYCFLASLHQADNCDLGLLFLASKLISLSPTP